MLLRYGEAFKSFHDGGSLAYNEGKTSIPRLDLGLKAFRLRPFRFYAAKLEGIDAVMYKAGREGRYEDQRQESLKGHVICQVFKVQKTFEECLADISLKTGFTQKQLVQKARNLYKAVKSNQVEGYEAAFEYLMRRVNEIGKYLKDNPKGYDRETLRLAFKEYLKRIDFQTALAELD
jgi:hypothetical protein